MTQQNQKLLKRIFWPSALFLILTPIALVALLITQDFNWSLLDLFILISSVMITEMSITAGYHRFFSHRAYEAHPILKYLYILVGSAAFQGSVLKWATDHRRHHRFVDGEEDPYSINKGFLFAHIGWMLIKDDGAQMTYAPDLAKDRWLMFQHRHYAWIATLLAFGVPTLIGAFFGNPLKGFVLGGLMRVVVSHHLTFMINSLAHTWGRQPFTDLNTARDSFWVAMMTCGEGYHNFHHCFQADYRNGIRWYDWDPTKWSIRAFSWFGLTSKLKRASPVEILKARLEMDQKYLADKGVYSETMQAFRDSLEESMKRWRDTKMDCQKLKLQWKELKQNSSDLSHQLQNNARLKIIHAKHEMQLARYEFQLSYQRWKKMKRMPNLMMTSLDS